MIKVFSKKYVFAAIAVFLLIGGGLVFFKSKGKEKYDFVVVQRKTITQQVSVTGRIKPAESVDLSFETTGKVSQVLAEVGDKVSLGQVLVRLENSELVAQLNQAKAGLEIQQAKLEELEKGTRPEELAVYQAKLESAQVSLAESEKNLRDKIADAFTKADDSVRNKTDQFFFNPRSASPSFNLTISDSQLKSEIEKQRFVIESILNAWGDSLESAKADLETVRQFLDNIALAVNSLTPTASLSQTTIDTYKANVSTARTNVSSATTALVVAEQETNTAMANSVLAGKELELKQAKALPEQISVQKSLVDQSQSQIDLVLAQLRKTVLVSPLNGVVTRQEARAGETVSLNSSLVSVISSSKFEIEANIPEADVAKVKVGDTAKVTLDAFGLEKVFEVRVSQVDPGETIVEGVAVYKTKFQFLKEQEEVKSGMTANIDILTATAENVLAIPQRAIVSKNGGKYVLVLDANNNTEEREVKTGLRDANGNMEIVQGLNEGEKIVLNSSK